MLETNISSEYLRALHMGQKEKKRLESAGRSPFPAVLYEICPDANHASFRELPVQDVPVDRIIGTVSKGRMNMFSEIAASPMLA